MIKNNLLELWICSPNKTSYIILCPNKKSLQGLDIQPYLGGGAKEQDPSYSRPLIGPLSKTEFKFRLHLISKCWQFCHCAPVAQKLSQHLISFCMTIITIKAFTFCWSFNNFTLKTQQFNGSLFWCREFFICLYITYIPSKN